MLFHKALILMKLKFTFLLTFLYEWARSFANIWINAFLWWICWMLASFLKSTQKEKAKMWEENFIRIRRKKTHTSSGYEKGFSYSFKFFRWIRSTLNICWTENVSNLFYAMNRNRAFPPTQFYFNVIFSSVSIIFIQANSRLFLFAFRLLFTLTPSYSFLFFSKFTGAEATQYFTLGDCLLPYHHSIGNFAISIDDELTVGSPIFCSLLHSHNWKCSDDSGRWSCSASTLRSDNGNFTSRKLLNSHISIQYKFPHSRFLFLPRSRSCLTPTIYFNWLLDRANVVYLNWIMFRAHTRCFQSHGPCL